LTATPTVAPTSAPTEQLATLFTVPAADAFREDGSSGALRGGLIAVPLVHAAAMEIMGAQLGSIHCATDGLVGDVVSDVIQWAPSGNGGAWGFSSPELRIRPKRAGVNAFRYDEGDRLVGAAAAAVVATRVWAATCTISSPLFNTPGHARSVVIRGSTARVNIPSYGGGCWHPRVNRTLEDAAESVAATCAAAAAQSSPHMILGSSSVFTLLGRYGSAAGAALSTTSAPAECEGGGTPLEVACLVAKHGHMPPPPFDANTTVWLGGVLCESMTVRGGEAVVVRAPTIAEIGGVGRARLEVRNAARGDGLLAGSLCFGDTCAALDPVRLQCAESGLCAPSKEKGIEIVDACVDAFNAAGHPICLDEENDRTCGASSADGCCWIGQGDSCRACPPGCLCPGGHYCYARKGWYSADKMRTPVRCEASDLTTARAKCNGWDQVRGQTSCGKGYEGDVCALCSDGYFQTFGDACAKCPSPASVWKNLGYIGIFVTSLFGATFVLVAVVQCYIGGSLMKGLRRTLRFVFWVIVLLQQQAQIGRMAGSNLPPALLAWYRLLLLLELNPSAGIPPQCAGGDGGDDESGLRFDVLLPVLFMTFALSTVPVWLLSAFDPTPITTWLAQMVQRLRGASREKRTSAPLQLGVEMSSQSSSLRGDGEASGESDDETDGMEQHRAQAPATPSEKEAVGDAMGGLNPMCKEESAEESGVDIFGQPAVLSPIAMQNPMRAHTQRVSPVVQARPYQTRVESHAAMSESALNLSMMSAATTTFTDAAQRVLSTSKARRAAIAAAKKQQKKKEKSCRSYLAKGRYFLGAIMVLAYPLVTVSALELLHCVPPPSSVPQLARGDTVLFSRMRVKCFTPSHTPQWLLAVATLAIFSIAWPIFATVRIALAVWAGGSEQSGGARAFCGGCSKHGGLVRVRSSLGMESNGAIVACKAETGTTANDVGGASLSSVEDAVVAMNEEADILMPQQKCKVPDTPDDCGDKCGWGRDLIAFQDSQDPSFRTGWRSITGTDYRPRVFYIRILNLGTIFVLAMCRTFLAPSSFILVFAPNDGVESPAHNALVVMLHLGRLVLIICALGAPSIAILLTCPFKAGSRWKLPLRILVLLLTGLLAVLNFSSFISTDAELRAADAVQGSSAVEEAKFLLRVNLVLAYAVLVYTAIVLVVLFAMFFIFVVCRGAQFERKQIEKADDAARAEMDEQENADIALGLSTLRSALPPPPARGNAQSHRRPALSLTEALELSPERNPRASTAPPSPEKLTLALPDVKEEHDEEEEEEEADAGTGERGTPLQLAVQSSVASVPACIAGWTPTAEIDPPSALVAKWRGICFGASNPLFRSLFPSVLHHPAKHVHVLGELYDGACRSYLERGSTALHRRTSSSALFVSGFGSLGGSASASAALAAKKKRAVTPALILRLVRERAHAHMIAHNLVAQLELVQLMGECDDASAVLWDGASSGARTAAAVSPVATTGGGSSFISRSAFVRAILVRMLRRPDGPVASWIADELSSAGKGAAAPATTANGRRSTARGSIFAALAPRFSTGDGGHRRSFVASMFRRGSSIMSARSTEGSSGGGGSFDSDSSFQNFARSYAEMDESGDGEDHGARGSGSIRRRRGTFVGELERSLTPRPVSARRDGGACSSGGFGGDTSAIVAAWQQVWDEASGSHYWFNATTSVTQWEAPAMPASPPPRVVGRVSEAGSSASELQRAEAEASAAEAARVAPSVAGWELRVENGALQWYAGWPGDAAAQLSWSLPRVVAEALVQWIVARAERTTRG